MSLSTNDNTYLRVATRTKLKHLAQGKHSVKISYFIVLILELINVLQGASFLDNYVKFCVYLHFPGRFYSE